MLSQGTAGKVENQNNVLVSMTCKEKRETYLLPGKNIQRHRSTCCLHCTSPCSPLLRIRLTLFSLSITSFLCLFLVGATLLHRYSTWLWSPKLPHMHIEHEQWASSSLLSVAI